MSSVELIVQYVSSCFDGALSVSECGPVWQLGIIVVLLVVFIAGFIVLRMRGAKEGVAEPR
ncbi:MAG: hypothetical protein OEZ08_07970 [Betaproteobacteria bacterium]|nr:hypothetical protein [Betaproteobacteria bacterium]